MELLLILIYVSLCYVVFKIFRIPVNQWSLATDGPVFIGIHWPSLPKNLVP